MRKTKGFTLAEVLITLGIIGIVAAMTVPNLMQSWKKQARLSQLKVAYSIISNSIKMATAENGDPSEWNVRLKKLNTGSETLAPDITGSSAAYAENYFFPYVKTKDKGDILKQYNKDYMIYNIAGEVTTKELIYNHSIATTLENGMLIILLVFWADDRDKVSFTVDLNGFKGPNILGNDVFRFRFYPDTGKFEGDASACSTNAETVSGWFCGDKIQQNGWKFPDDYPIKKF